MNAFVHAVSAAAEWLFDDEDESRADAALTHIGNDAPLATLDTALAGAAVAGATIAGAAVAEGLVLIEPVDRPR